LHELAIVSPVAGVFPVTIGFVVSIVKVIPVVLPKVSLAMNI
jgi:hypothetical protein